MKKLSFQAIVEKSKGRGGWHYISLLAEIRAQLSDISGKNGNVPVIATVCKTTFSTTIMSMGQQRWFFGIKSPVRIAEDTKQGDKVNVSLTPDESRLK